MVVPLAGYVPAALIAGVVMGLGVWSVVAGIGGSPARNTHSSSVLLRVARSLADISPDAKRLLSPQASDPVTIFGRIAHPWLVAMSIRLDALAGGPAATARLIARSGWALSAADYRALRVVWAGGGAGVAMAATATVFVARPSLGVVGVVVAGMIGVVVGVWVSDWRLHQAAKKRREDLLEQFPTMVELLALTLSAGQSLPNALERVATRAGGVLGTQWRSVLAQVDLGAPLGPTLRQSADDLGVPELSALVDHLVFAMERGSPLAEIVRAHSGDARAERLRAIVERSGKAEIAMLVPLVLLILPITVLFAVWPGLQALQLGL